MVRRLLLCVLSVVLLATVSFAQRRGGTQTSGSQPSTPTGGGIRNVPTGGLPAPGRIGGNGPFDTAQTGDTAGTTSRSGGSGGESVDVRLAYTDDRPAPEHIMVELHATTGETVGSGVTSPEGQVEFKSIAAGSYFLRITGPGVKDRTTEAFNVMPRERIHTEWVQVERDEVADNAGSKDGTVSAADLNVPDKARKEFKKGNDAMAAGDLKKAVEHFQRAVQLYPRYSNAYNNLGALYARNADTANARAAFEKAVEINPGLPSANVNLARLDIRDHKAQDAIPLLARGLATAPTDVELLALMCQAQYLAQHYDEAIAYAGKVHAADHQKYATVHVIAGQAYEALRKPAEARAQYELFVQEDPSSTLAGKIRSALGETTAQQAAPAAVK